MLVLTRKVGEDIYMGEDIRIVVLGIRGGHVKIGLEASDDIPIRRGELPNWDDTWQKPDERCSLVGLAHDAG